VGAYVFKYLAVRPLEGKEPFDQTHIEVAARGGSGQVARVEIRIRSGRYQGVVPSRIMSNEPATFRTLPEGDRSAKCHKIAYACPKHDWCCPGYGISAGERLLTRG
jgi:hypothetical protein